MAILRILPKMIDTIVKVAIHLIRHFQKAFIAKQQDKDSIAERRGVDNTNTTNNTSQHRPGNLSCTKWILPNNIEASRATTEVHNDARKNYHTSMRRLATWW
jgi:hypothetical protein